MEPGELSQKRYDVFPSAHGVDTLKFPEQGPESVNSFVSRYLLEKIHTTWRDNGGLGRLSVFWQDHDTSETLDENMKALLQTRGGGLVVCLITKNYFSNSRCVRELKKAAKFFHKKGGERVRLRIVGLGMDADAVQQHGIMKEAGLERVRVLPTPADVSDGPGVVARKHAERIVQRLLDAFIVAGEDIKSSFSFLLENINRSGLSVDTFSARLGLRGAFTAPIHLLMQAESRGLISPRNIKKLKEVFEGDEGSKYLRSYEQKWCEYWVDESWDSLFTEALRNGRGSGREGAMSETPTSLRPRRCCKRDIQACEDIIARQTQTVVKMLQTDEEAHRDHRKASQVTDQWIQDFSTVPPMQEFVDKDAVPSVKNLLEAILNASCGDAVGAIGAHGIGGVGKTTACTIVANDEQVRKRFFDGVFWLDLGMGITAEEVQRKLVKILRRSGGFCAAQEVDTIESKKMTEAVSEARLWLCNRNILIVVDNVWPEMVGGASNWISLLRRLVGAGGCLLFSTRSGSLADAANALKVEFDMVEDVQSAGSIFDKHLGLRVDDARYRVDARDRIVSKCKGLPLALANAALLVACTDYDWSYVDEDLEEALLNAKSDGDKGGHPGLVSTISVTLAELDDGKLDGWLVRTARKSFLKYSWSEMYHALAVLPKRTASMPVSILAILWGLEGTEAKRVMFAYCDLGLGSVVDGEVLKLHDLQLEYCSDVSINQSSLHEVLVRRFPHLLEARHAKKFGQVKDEEIINTLISKQTRFKCTEYLVDNAVWHMTMAYGELWSLLRRVLTDYRWIRKKAELRSLISVIGDYDLAVSTARKVAKEIQSDHRGFEEVEGYTAIRNALQRVPYEASPGMMKRRLEKDPCPVHGEGGDGYPDSGLAFQLVGRLGFQYGALTPEHWLDDEANKADGVSPRNIVVGEFLASVEKHVIGPWIYPLKDIFNDLKSEAERRIPVGGGQVTTLALSKDDTFVYSGSEDGVVRKHDPRSGECMGELRGHMEPVYSVAVAGSKSEDCDEVVFSGSEDGTIKVWSMPSMSCVATLKAHADAVSSLAVSQDGNRLVSGSEDETVRVWIREEKSSWTSEALVGHLGAVTSVALSVSNREVASASRDCTVRIWREGCSSGGSPGNRRTFQAVESLSVKARVSHVAFASGEYEPEVIFVMDELDGVGLWDRNAFGSFRVIGTGPTVHAVAFSERPEGKLIVGSYRDGIRLWRMDNGLLVRQLSGEDAARVGVSMTRDGRRVVCGSQRGVIEIWPVGASNAQEVITRRTENTNKSNQVLAHVTLEAHDVVTCHNRGLEIWKGAISANGNKLVTVDRSGEITVWNGVSGKKENTWNSGRGFASSIALSRNARYFALDRWGVFYVWNTEAQRLEYSGNGKNAFDGLTAYANNHGLERDSYPVTKCDWNSIPGFSVSSSAFALHVSRRRPSSTDSIEGSVSMCSCTASAMLDFDLTSSSLWKLPYVCGLDIWRSSVGPALGMIALDNYYYSLSDKLTLFVIVDQKEAG